MLGGEENSLIKPGGVILPEWGEKNSAVGRMNSEYSHLARNTKQPREKSEERA